MAEIIDKSGTWTFDGEGVRIVPGHDKGVSLLRRTLGEIHVPLGALAGVSYAPGKKSGLLKLRIREGADPLLEISRGRLDDASDPYQLSVSPERAGVAEYFVDEVRNALLLDGIGDGPVDSYLLPGPSVPLSVGAGDGTVTFDGERVRLEWNWKTDDTKAAGGPRVLDLADIVAVEWLPATGLENGYLRFRATLAASPPAPKYDPLAVELWGFRKDPLMAVVGAAVLARLRQLPVPRDAPPHPSPATTGDDHDVLLRRLRELGELHHSGILNDEEFAAAKQAVLKRM
ncbi:DUF4429 domain-containing protein [Streptomyces sp. NPDC127084]|uniref:DUF4429 domain-containing protein n=1 Tax=Streptomyces sp. NPDC127084 TaxID=3347133 RepID=UPI003663770B